MCQIAPTERRCWICNMPPSLDILWSSPNQRFDLETRNFLQNLCGETFICVNSHCEDLPKEVNKPVLTCVSATKDSLCHCYHYISMFVCFLPLLTEFRFDVRTQDWTLTLINWSLCLQSLMHFPIFQKHFVLAPLKFVIQSSFWCIFARVCQIKRVWWEFFFKSVFMRSEYEK